MTDIATAVKPLAEQSVSVGERKTEQRLQQRLARSVEPGPVASLRGVLTKKHRDILSSPDVGDAAALQQVRELLESKAKAIAFAMAALDVAESGNVRHTLQGCDGSAEQQRQAIRSHVDGALRLS